MIRNSQKLSAGFSVIEIIVVVAIVTMLAALAMLGLSTMRDRLLLNDAERALAFHLEETKARAVAGTGGTPHGMYFADNAYTEFVGNVYDADDADNVPHELDPRLQLTTDILSGEASVVFARITGTVSEAVTITVALRRDPDVSRIVQIGPGGDISYGE